MELTESQISAEISNAQRDIEERLNALELRTGRPVLSMTLERLDISTIMDERPRWIRSVRIAVTPPPGQIGKA